MSNDVYIFEVSENNFNDSVLLNSGKIPVLVEFMGVWSGPCIMMSDMLSGLAKEFAGQFIFAKVDIDEQPGLRKQYNIENVPTLLIFRDGKAIRTEVGQLSEEDLRAVLKDLGIFHESDAIREQARNKHLAGDTPAAIMLLADAIKKDPGNTRIAMDMVQIFLDIDQFDNAKGLFDKLPEVDKNSDMGKSLNGQLTFAALAAKTEGMDALNKKLLQQPDNHIARFDLAVCQIAKHQYNNALDNLLHIIKKEANFRDGAAREMFIMILNMLTPTQPETAQEYRRKLSSMLNH